MEELAWLTGLQRLGLAGTGVSDGGLGALRAMASLREVNLDWCSAVGDAGAHTSLGHFERLFLSKSARVHDCWGILSAVFRAVWHRAGVAAGGMTNAFSESH